VKFMDRVPSRSHAAGVRMLQIMLAAGAAWTLVAADAEDAAARGMGFGMPYGWYDGWYAPPAAIPSRKPKVAPARREKAEPKKETGFGDMPKGPLQIVVSIDHQTVTLFSNGVRVAQGPVSTGVPGHPTPMGVFSIIEKDRYHRSNLYSNAPMPYMQRITWSGVALHEGPLPGYPASHGCIRMSHDFARKLWPVTKLGVRVIVARHQLAPVDFEHPKLFKPKLKPAEPEIAISGRDARNAPPATMIAQAAIADAGSEGTETVPQGSVTDPSELGGSDNVKPAPTVDPAKPPEPPAIRAVEEPPKRSGQVAVFVSRKEQKIFVRQAFIPLFDMPVVIEDADHPLGTHVFTAMEVTENGAGMRWNLITVPFELTAPERKDARKKNEAKPIFRQKPLPSAAEALNRIQMPQEAVERISELLIPGSSLVVSDEGLGRETGRYTEFIVVSP
jgi:L,D-transpeptidase catalytic domain